MTRCLSTHEGLKRRRMFEKNFNFEQPLTFFYYDDV